MKTLGSERRGWRRLVRLLGPGLLAVAVLVLAASPAVSSPPPPPHPVPGGSLDPTTIPKYKEPLVIPPAMPRTQVLNAKGKQIDYYEIAVKQFEQYILPEAWSEENDIDPTTVWSYASMLDPRPVAEGGTLNYPALTIEAQKDRPVRVKWINGLVDENGNYLPHLFAVDQTLHWANPPGGPGGTDTHGMDAEPYTGPVPIVTHVHGAHTTEDSDGYPGGLVPAGRHDIPAGYATGGTYYQQYKQEFEDRWGQTWEPGTAIFQYPNDQRPTTLWYHDHSLGMTRAQRVRGPRRLLPGPQQTATASPSGSPSRRRSAVTSPVPSTTRSRSPSRTGRSTPTDRCSTRTTAPSSRA